MGTGSKSSHQSYAVSPTALAELPSAPVDLAGPATAEEVPDLAGAAAGAGAEAPDEQQPLPEADAGFQTDADFENFVAEALNDAVAGLEPDESWEESQQPAATELLEAEGPAEPEPEGDETSTNEEPGTDDVSLAAEDFAEVEEEEEKDPPLTPVPAEPPLGAPTGAPILVGGDDFINSEATLVAYNSADGPREVLLAHVSEEAEEKLLDALSIPGTHMEDQEVEVEVKERLQLDKDNHLAEKTKSAISSVQHKLKNDLEISENSIAKHQAAVDAVSAVLNDPGVTDENKVMALHYMDQLNQVKEKIDAGGGEPMPWMDAYELTTTKTVTQQVEVPNGEPEPGALSATVRQASRLDATLNQVTGQSSWDGVARNPAQGKEFEIDMGDGWTAVYRSYRDNDPQTTEYSLRGQLEVHAPPGAGHGKDLVERLEQLHLMNKPMTAAEGEWTYLSNNIQAQGLGNAAGMKAALDAAQGLQDLQAQEITHQRMETLMGLDSDALQTALKRIQLEAGHKVLPMKVEVVREAVAKAAGFASGAELAASPGYEPKPSTTGRWLTWSRFDVTGKQEAVKSAFGGRAFTHSVGSGSLAKLLGTGVLASSEKRAVMGISSGVGMSEYEDKMTGGANSVFVRVQDSGSGWGGGTLVWDDPSVLMQRSDYYGYNGDHFGAINPKHHKYSKSAMTRDPMKIAQFHGGANEIMFRNGIDLLGAEAPSRIVCTSAGERQKILNSFAERGITELRGKPVEDVLCLS